MIGNRLQIRRRRTRVEGLLVDRRRRQQSSLVVSLLMLGGVCSLVGLGACAQQQTPVVAPPTLVAPGARLTKNTPFQINTSVFLIKQPERVSELASYYKAGMTQTRVVQASDWKALIAGLQQSRHVITDEYSDGSAVTVVGQPAVYEAIRELIHPVEYDPPQLPENHSVDAHGAFPVTPAHPTKFESKNCGFQSWVTPMVKSSGDLEVNLKAESRNFDGFVNYGSPITTAASDWLGNPVSVVLTDNRIEMPVFTTGKLESRVRVSPTDYVVIAGLPQGKPLNVALTNSKLISNEPISLAYSLYMARTGTFYSDKSSSRASAVSISEVFIASGSYVFVIISATFSGGRWSIIEVSSRTA